MRRFVQILCGTLLAAFILLTPLIYWYYLQSHMRNFRVVKEGVLYRSGQMTVAGLQRAIHDYGIKTVVTLRDAFIADQEPPDVKEEAYCKSQEITYCRIPPRNWEGPDGYVPAQEGVNRFRRIMDNPKNYPVLVHCLAGIHRTGAYCAIYRMEYEHWTNQRAIAEVKACGYSNLDNEWDILGYLESFRPRWQDSNSKLPK